ncbi:MAG: DUF2461 domain-containing protein [Anaerolineae bacterium]|nr:DUF2461 domain-containing protein [Anaerolineae bacterium]
MTGNAYITPELFTFFRELRENNHRAWFQANKSRYEAQVREPLLQFITDFGLRLAEISPYYVADARRVGGSLFRIYRDIRFAKDKTPYKTAAGIQFRHESGKDVHAPGFYLHLEPDNVFAGAGIWQPDLSTLNQIRDAIVADPAGWRQIMSDEAFQSTYSLEGEILKRPPKGYDPDHPLIEYLKRKDFVAGRPFSETEACAPDFMDRFAEGCRIAAPFTAFLTRAVGLPW